MSLGLFLLLRIPLIFCSGMLYLAKFPTFYSLPMEFMALALVVWGLLLLGCAEERASGQGSGTW